MIIKKISEKVWPQTPHSIISKSHPTDFLMYSDFLEHEKKYQKVMKELIETSEAKTAKMDFLGHQLGDMRVKETLLQQNSTTWNINKDINLLSPNSWKNSFSNVLEDSFTNNTIAKNKFLETLKKTDFWKPEDISEGLKKYRTISEEAFNQGITQRYSMEKIPEYDEIILRITQYLSKSFSKMDCSFLLEYTIYNEKISMLLMFPLFMYPLKELLWSKMLPCVHVKGQFIKLMFRTVKNIANVLYTKITTSYLTVKVSTRTKLVGLTSLGSSVTLFLYSNFLKTQDNKSLLNHALYTGFTGVTGKAAELLRLEGSKLIYEMAKTLSTFSNAALAGFFEPKQNVVKHIMSEMKEIFKRR